MSQVPLALVFLVLNQWPFRWLARLWLIVLSLQFLVVVGIGPAVIAGLMWIFGLSAALRDVALSSDSHSIPPPPGA